MKEATGELSGTVITVVAIAAIAAIFTVVLLPVLKANIKARTYCASATCGKCEAGKANCVYYDEDMKEQEISCSCDQ